jgi:hypothetical protein
MGAGILDGSRGISKKHHNDEAPARMRRGFFDQSRDGGQ